MDYSEWVEWDDELREMFEFEDVNADLGEGEWE